MCCCRRAQPGGRYGEPGSAPPAASRRELHLRRARPGPRLLRSRRARRPRRSPSRQRHLLRLDGDDAVPALEAGLRLTLGLADFPLQPDPPAAGALLGHRPIPGREVAVRVPNAAPERFAPFGASFCQLTLQALGTLDPKRDRAAPLALGIARTGEKFAEPAGPDHHRSAAKLAFLVRRPIGDLVLLERLSVVAGLFVVDASEIGSEPSGPKLDLRSALGASFGS